MKKYTLLIAIMIFSKIVVAQCDNNVSTNPSAPTNNALPDVQPAIPGTVPYQVDTRYLNGFDWVNGNAGLPNQEYSLLGMMYNPTQPYTTMSNIQNVNLTGYYVYLNKILGNDLMRIENGWELMLINLGRYPDNTPHFSTDLNSIPYLVFYNKFTGVLRVFVQFGYNQPPPNSINGVRIDLKYTVPNITSKNVSGILRLSGGKDRALNLPTTSKKITAVAPKEGQVNFWMSGDFQLTYDPCVCVHITQLDLTFNFFSETDFKLHGRGIEVEEPLISNSTILDKDFLSNVDPDLIDKEGGLIIYESIYKLIDDYIAKMEDYNDRLIYVNRHNKEVKENLLIAKAVRKIITVGITAAVGTPEILALQSTLVKLFFNDNSDKSKEKVKKLFEKFSEIAGKQFDTYVSKNFVLQNAPQKPIVPTANFSEMYFSGTLTDTDIARGPTFTTPGSFKNNVSIDPITNQPVNNILDLPYQDVYGYPVYNQPVGVFALLEQPVLEKSEHNIVTSISNPISSIIHNKIQYKLKAPLKYTFNPALNITTKNIEAMIVIKAINDPTSNILAPANLGYNFYTNVIDKSINLISESVNTYSNDVIIDYLKQENQQGVFNKKIDTLVYTSTFLPIDVLNTMVFEMSTSENLGGFNYSAPSGSANSLLRSYWSDIKVELKLKVDVQFAGTNTDGNPNKFTYIFTYEIGESYIVLKNTELYPSLANSIADIYQYEEDLDFSNLVFNGTPIEGCELNGNSYTCQAWNDITINGNLSTSNGYTVNLIAGNQIETFPESVISPEINLSIVPVLNYSQPMPEATSTYVSNFCNKLLADSLDYQANSVPVNKILLDSVQEIQNSISNSLNLTNNELDFQLFPNPSTQLTTVVVEGNESGLATLSIFDIMGKEQNLIIQGQNGQFNFDVSTLAKGMYFVKVNTIGASKTKQLIVK
jgi:hypothetical protein